MIIHYLLQVFITDTSYSSFLPEMSEAIMLFMVAVVRNKTVSALLTAEETICIFGILALCTQRRCVHGIMSIKYFVKDSRPSFGEELHTSLLSALKSLFFGLLYWGTGLVAYINSQKEAK